MLNANRSLEKLGAKWLILALSSAVFLPAMRLPLTYVMVPVFFAALVAVITTAAVLRRGYYLTAQARKAETSVASLRDSMELFRVAFDYASIGMAIVSATGQWLRANRALCEILGYTEQELLAKDF